MNNIDKSFIVQKIRAQYTERKITELEKLRKLDSAISRPANIFAYTFGTISALVMGFGMSLTMTELGTFLGLGNAMLPGIATGVVGMLCAIVNFPLYKRILNSRRKKHAAEIIALSDEIINNN